MTKREQTIYMIAGLMVGLVIMPIAFGFGIAVIGIGFLAACANSMVGMVENLWSRSKNRDQRQAHHSAPEHMEHAA
ncbi:hypothetical protein [Roseibium sediminis]|uniref:hypothetical protein n=1 Tax=Roseibium sediminis TaxID=1775174 RepID=UPI00123E1C12|nr:hypothetical protein [Roseibium sediminis]